jgi:hypothetical protein
MLSRQFNFVAGRQVISIQSALGIPDNPKPKMYWPDNATVLIQRQIRHRQSASIAMMICEAPRKWRI